MLASLANLLKLVQNSSRLSFWQSLHSAWYASSEVCIGVCLFEGLYEVVPEGFVCFLGSIIYFFDKFAKLFLLLGVYLWSTHVGKKSGDT